MKSYIKTPLYILFSASVLFTSTASFACVRHDPTCITNCLKLPKWEQFFCMIGSPHKKGNN
jgi:hypothetical protein